VTTGLNASLQLCVRGFDISFTHHFGGFVVRNQKSNPLARRRSHRIARWAVALVSLGGLGNMEVQEANGAPTPLLVAGSLTFDSLTGNGYDGGGINVAPGFGVNNSGVAVGYTDYRVSGTHVGQRAVRWNSTDAEVLGHLGAQSNGTAYAYAYAINDNGSAVGYSSKIVSGNGFGSSAVRWDASGTAATELGNLGLDGTGTTTAFAYANNDAGTTVGTSYKYVLGISVGNRAVRWDASGTVATELGNLGLDGSGTTYAAATAINDAGTAVGLSRKYVSGTLIGNRAVRWDASGTTATELGHLGTSDSGNTNAHALYVNEAGVSAGQAAKYVANGHYGDRAVRWAANSIDATELGNLGVDSIGRTISQVSGINDAGTIVGYANKYVAGAYKGRKPVRWDYSGTAATELSLLGTTSTGGGDGQAYGVNDAGLTIGYSEKYVGGTRIGNRAVIWLPNTTSIDLNDLGLLATPVGGTWLLTAARAISSDGWVAGEGTFDPDGTAASYSRHWVTQVGLGGEWTDDFSGSLDGTWGRGKQWSTGTPAMQVGNATFNANAAYTVSLDRDELTNHVQINTGTITFAHNGFTLTATDGITIADGAMLKGGGMIIGDVLVEGTISPGNSPGTMPIVGNSTWASGGSFEWEINKADGTAGADPGWDVYAITGILNIAANAGNEFTIDMTTLDLLNAAGLMDGFDASSDYAWTIATADGGITGFDASAFLLNTTAFTNPFNGTFGISQISNRLDLTYTAIVVNVGSAIPEPSMICLLILGGSTLAIRRHRGEAKRS